ncbi:MAG TPA: YIP1 family protein [Bryobacteraceae bacterium]|jgi:hypothetical protein|nr:YIP1 family protein [Bryobacteraceae bacterium]
MPELIEVFTQPGALFTSLPERRVPWLSPLIANTLLLTASTAATLNVVGMELIMRQRLANSNMSPEQMQQAIQRASSPVATYFSYGAVAVGTPLAMLAIAGALFAFGLMTKRAPKYPSMLAMVCLAFFPYFLVTVVMTVIVLFAAPDKSALDLSNLLATNVGAFVSKSDTSKGMYSLLTSLDLLSFFEIGFMSFGFSKLTKSGLFGGLGAVGSLWVLYVLCKMALSFFQ